MSNTASSPEHVVTAALPPAPLFDISPQALQRAALARYGAGVQVSAPYWVDQDTVRVGIGLENGNISFGANFHYKTGAFH